MEKPKHKDGMLAAGKKRLEQFRQKKQGKGSASKHAKPEIDLEHGGPGSYAEPSSLKGKKAKGSTHRTLSDDLEAVNTRSDSGRNEVSIDLKLAGADDADSQINAEHISASDLDRGSAHALNFEDNALEQCGETEPKMGNSEPCSRVDSLEPSGLDLMNSPPITGYLKTPVESELSVGGSESRNVSVAPDLSIDMANLVLPNVDANHGMANLDDSTTEMNGERVVMNSFCSDHAEASQEYDKEQGSMNSVESSAAASPRINQLVELTAEMNTDLGNEKASSLQGSMNSVESSAAASPRINQLVELTAEMNTDLGDEKTSILHVDAKHIQEANFTGQSCSKLAASSQDFTLQSMSREQEKDTSRRGRELDSGAAGMLPGFNTTLVNLEHMGVATQVENKEQNLPSSCDAETGANYILVSKSKSEADIGTDVVDTAPLAVSVTESNLSPISEIPVAAEPHCADIVMGLGSDECSNLKQSQSGELDDTKSSSNFTGIPSDSNMNQVGLCLNEDCGLKTSTDDTYHDVMPVILTEGMTSIDGEKEIAVLDASEPADEIVELNCVKKITLSEVSTDDNCGINEDAISVPPKIDGNAHEVSFVHISQKGLISNVVSDQNPETDHERGSSRSGFHEIMEAGENSRDSGVNSEWTTAVEPGQAAMESVHAESIVSPIQESFSGDDLNCSTSLHSLEAEQAITGEDQKLKTSASSIDGEVGCAIIMEVEEIVTSNAFHDTTGEADILGSDSGSGVADITMHIASAKIEAECKATLKPEFDMDDCLDSGLAPSEKSEVVQATVEDVTNEAFNTSTAEMGFQLQMDKFVEESVVLGQNLRVDGVVPVMKVEPLSELNTASLKHEEYARPELHCCNQELSRTKVSLECEIDEPDIAQRVVAIDNSFADHTEVGDTLSGGSNVKHELDTFAVSTELSLSNTVEQRTDDVLSRNSYLEHKSEYHPPIKDELPLELPSRADVHDHEADWELDFNNCSHSSFDSGPSLDPNYIENKLQVLVPDGAFNSGNGVEFPGRNSESREKPTEISQFDLAMQSSSESTIECDSIILEPCKSYEVVSLVDEIALPLVEIHTLGQETEHLSLEPLSQDLSNDVSADADQNDTVRNTQKGHSLTGQLSRSFDKSDLPFENEQGHTWTGQKSRGFDESTFNEEAGLGNKINSPLSVGVSQHVEDKGFEEQSMLNKIGSSFFSGREGQAEAENVIRELREALSMKEAEMENFVLLLNCQAAKNNEQRDMAGKVLMHVVNRLVNLVSQGSSVNEDGDLHAQHLKPFEVDNGGLERAELINLDQFPQAFNYWIDELQKDLEGKRQTEIMRRQLEDTLIMKDVEIKDLNEKVKELSQNYYELQMDSEQMKDLEMKTMQLEKLSAIKDTEIGRLSDKVSELSQNCDVAMDEVAKVVEERTNLEGDLKDLQKLYAEQESKASQMEELLSIKDTDLERLFNKVAELSQNYDLAMSEVAKSVEERLSLAAELNHFQKLSAEREEVHLRMCTQASTVVEKISDLMGPSSISVDPIHGDPFDTLENLVASLQGHYESVLRESKDLLLMANDSDAAHQVEVNNLRALVSAKEVELAHVQEKVDSLTDELSKTREDGERKVQEAEQKALGVRERLSLAVTKGKGLVQQRDNLKQLLAEKTAEFETLASAFKQEIHLKTVALNEAEARVKLNSEAVEHVEALESELSYIRNSANALRESFLQKDAVLQKIEELLEDANLPEELQIKDIYEKVEWLLEANTQKTSTLEGQDHSETVATREMNAFPVAEQASQMQEIDHLNRKCDELLRKYRSMAEQSAMLEQSLLERNLLIQRWEEMLDALDMPASVRLKEPEDKIEWLGTTVSDAQTSIVQFQAEIESLQKTIEALDNAFQKLQEENVVLSMELAAKNNEMRTVALELEDMTVKCNSLSKPMYKRSDDGMPLSQAGLGDLEESELKEEVRQQPQFQIEVSETFITDIHTLLSEIMQGDEVDKIFSGGLASTVLEDSVKILVENNKVLSTEATEAKGRLAELTSAMRVAENDREKELQNLHEELSLKTLELNDVTIQLEGSATKNSLLEDEVDNLHKRLKAITEELSSAKDELSKSQLEASQLEDKLASTREKLSMAVKKGKSVVQQRDALKQSLDEKTTELSQIRKDHEAENLAFTKAKQSLKHHLQQVEMLEAELLSSRNYASSLEKSMHESNRTIQKFAEALDKISISGAPRSGDLEEKIQGISQLVFDLQRKAAISEQEAKKSKKATELLALELEEVQGRIDTLADELMHAEKNISLLIEEKKLAEASKAEAGLRLEHAMANINSLLFELSESRENQANLEQENNSLKDSLSAQMEEIRYKQTKAEQQHKDLTDLYSKVHQLKANQSTFLGMVADQIFNSSKDIGGTKNLVLRIAGELKDQGFISSLTAPVLADSSLSKWQQPEKTSQEWKQGVTTGSLKMLCDEMETELQHFENFFKSFLLASNQDSIAISQLLMEISDGLGPLSQKMLTLKRDADFVSSTESLILQKDEQIRVSEEVLKAVTERLRYSIKDIEVLIEEVAGRVSQSGTSSPHLLDGKVPYTSFENLQALTFSLVERLSSTAKDLAYSCQQGDIQKERQNENLRNQLSRARAVIDAMDHQQQADKLKISELQKCLEEFEGREDILKTTNQELSSLNDVLSTKKQEEGNLIEALNNAEMKIGELLAKVEELEKAKQELEASLGKASSRLYTTVSNFNRFQSLSEKLIEEAESLHLLLEDRDAQISLLKEEVTLKGSEVVSLQNLVNEKTTELSQFYQQVGEIAIRDTGSGEYFPDSELERETGSRKELLEALATRVRVGTESLQVQLARKDALLQDVQLRHDDLARKVIMLESSLLENQRLMEKREHTSVTDRMMISVEAEEKGNRGKHVTPSVAIVTHGRGGRKVSAPSDHLALDVDMESSRLLADMDDEDKGHVFKPLASSRLVPRGTRILVDRVDGLWVSGERLLRRRPGARLSVMLYWLVLHIWMVAILL